MNTNGATMVETNPETVRNPMNLFVGGDVREVEFNSKDEAKNFKAPDWFGREVTEDPRFEGRNLVDAEVQRKVMKEIAHLAWI